MNDTKKSQRRTPLPRWLIEAANRTLVAVAQEHGVLIARLCNPARKDRAVAAARAEVFRRLRDGFSQRDNLANTEFADGRPKGWRPLSYPTIAALVDMDHSTVIYALRRTGKATPAADPASPSPRNIPPQP